MSDTRMLVIIIIIIIKGLNAASIASIIPRTTTAICEMTRSEYGLRTTKEESFKTLTEDQN